MPERPGGLLCANDCAALGVVRGASSLGMRIPEELSVVGFDDQEFALLATPSLTTVRVPTGQIGRQAVRQLMLQLRVESPRQERGCEVRVKTELVVRQSTGPWRGI